MNLKLHGKTFTIDKMTGEMICNCGCGRVLTEKMESLEDLEFDGVKDHTFLSAKRAGGSRTSIRQHDMNLGSKMTIAKYDFRSEQVSPEVLSQFYRFHDLNKRNALKPEQRRLWNHLIQLSRFKEQMGVPDIIADKVAYWLHSNHRNHGMKSWRTEWLIAALVYHFWKNTSPITLREFGKKSGIEKSKICKSLAHLKMHFSLEDECDNKTFDKLLLQMGAKAEAGVKSIQIAREIAAICKDDPYVGGKDPVGFAAAVIWLAMQVTRKLKNQSPYAMGDFHEVFELSAQTRGVHIKFLREKCSEYFKKLGLKTDRRYFP